MISLETIENDIAELEKHDTCFATCERLAWLYIVRDHLRGYNVSPEATMHLNGASDFMQAVNGKRPESVLKIVDELVGTVQALHPKIYEKFMDKIKEEVD